MGCGQSKPSPRQRRPRREREEHPMHPYPQPVHPAPHHQPEPVVYGPDPVEYNEPEPVEYDPEPNEPELEPEPAHFAPQPPREYRPVRSVQGLGYNIVSRGETGLGPDPSATLAEKRDGLAPQINFYEIYHEDQPPGEFIAVVAACQHKPGVLYDPIHVSTSFPDLIHIPSFSHLPYLTPWAKV